MLTTHSCAVGWVTSVLPSQHPGLGWAQLCSVPSVHPSVKGMSTQTIPDQSMCDAQFCPHSSTVMSQMLLSHVSVTRSPTLGSAHPVGEVPRCQGQGSPRTSPELTSQCGDPRATSPLPSIPPAKCQQGSAPSTSHPRPDGVAPSSAIVSPSVPLTAVQVTRWLPLRSHTSFCLQAGSGAPITCCLRERGSSN